MEINFYPNDYAISWKHGTIQHLLCKHDICKKFNPSVIVEIGVRAGYSAQALLQACPNARYIGLDCNNGLYGGASDGRYTDFAKEQLKQYNATIITDFDSQKAKELPICCFDFAHIDADHSMAGALHDMELCYAKMKSTSVILVDDYDMHTVKDAVYDFLKTKPHMDYYALVYKDVNIGASKNCIIFNKTILQNYDILKGM